MNVEPAASVLSVDEIRIAAAQAVSIPEPSSTILALLLVPFTMGRRREAGAMQ